MMSVRPWRDMAEVEGQSFRGHTNPLDVCRRLAPFGASFVASGAFVALQVDGEGFNGRRSGRPSLDETQSIGRGGTMTDDTEKGIQEPKQDRIGNDYHEGSNPNPGGEINTEGSLVPPYEERSTGASGSASQSAGAESVSRQLRGTDAPAEANPESLVGPTGGSPGKEPPKHTGESIGRRGEDQAKHSKEAGRHNEEEGDETGRPSGTSTARDQTSI